MLIVRKREGDRLHDRYARYFGYGFYIARKDRRVMRSPIADHTTTCAGASSGLLWREISPGRTCVCDAAGRMVRRSS